MNSWTRIDRSLLDWEYFKDRNTLQVYIYCLLKINYKDTTYKGQLIPAGSFATTIKEIAESTGLTYKQVRTALDHLKSCQNEGTIEGTILEVSKTSNFLIITVNSEGLTFNKGHDEGTIEGTPIEIQTIQHTRYNNLCNSCNVYREDFRENLRNNKNTKIPLITDIFDYAREKNYRSDPNRFYKYNEQKGWLPLKTGELTWQKLFDKWEEREFKKPNNRGRKPTYDIDYIKLISEDIDPNDTKRTY